MSSPLIENMQIEYGTASKESTQKKVTSNPEEGRTKGLLITTALFILGGLLVFLLVRYWDSITLFMEPFFLWLEENLFLGIFAYIFIYIIFVILVIPGTIMTLGGAFTFGMVFGGIKGYLIALVLVLISATLGAMLAFLIGRYLIRDYLKKNVIQKINLFEAIDRGLG
mmetsp:Transcript_10150/g.10116  ORF Transcript_10150/g.10116 Transcript_10150/m.10116 type:complete len:168 (+) Transcript_10150:51-554(+)